MIASAIRALAVSSNSASIAAALFSKKIQIWDPRSRKMIGEFTTIFQAGAGNLAMAPDGGMLVAGLSRNPGAVAAYEIPSGKELWRRGELNYPSSLQFDSKVQSILCTVDDKSVLRLEVGSGTTIEEIGDTSRRVEGPYGSTLVVPPRRSKLPYRLVTGDNSFDVDPASFALLGAAFSPWSACLTEAGGTVRSFRCDDG